MLDHGSRAVPRAWVLGHVRDRRTAERVVRCLPNGVVLIHCESLTPEMDTEQTVSYPPIAVVYDASISCCRQRGADGGRRGVHTAGALATVPTVSLHDIASDWRLRETLATARRAAIVRSVLRDLERRAPPIATRVAHLFLKAGASSVDDIARTIGVSRRTLHRHCVNALSMPASRVIGWTRVLIALRLLDESHYTIDAVALELRYPSDVSLRNLVKRYTGYSVTDVRRRGGYDCALAGFLAQSIAWAPTPAASAR